MTLKKQQRYILLAAVFAGLGFVGWACSTQHSENSAATTNEIQQSSPTTSLFFTEKLNLNKETYESSLIKYRAGDETSYWQWVKTKNQSRGTIVYSLPYTGIDWSGEDVDQQWAANAEATQGYWAADVHGPAYDKNSSKMIFYQKTKKESVPEMGAAFSANGYDVLYVYHRFYAGRSVEDYVGDIEEAVNWLKSQNPDLPLGLYGFSFGGWIVAQAAKRISAGQVQAVILISPLLGWHEQEKYMKELRSRITDPEQLNEYFNFYEPLKRRFDSADASVQEIPQLNVPTLLIHDEWDTLVPVSQADLFEKQNSTSITYLKHTHPISLDLTLAQRDHWQREEGENMANNAVFYLAFAFSHLDAFSSAKTIPYSQIAMDQLWKEMHDVKVAGHDISGFQKGLKNLCHPQLNLEETQHLHDSESGTQYLTRKLNEVWGRRETEGSVCTSLENSSL
jgi:dienelactone hydrolase